MAMVYESVNIPLWRGLFANESVFICHQELSADACSK